MFLVSNSDSDSPNESRNRPKTRAALVSYIEEDLEQIQEAIKEKARGALAARKWLVKLKSEYGRDAKREHDPDFKMKEPKEDEDPGYDDQPSDLLKKSPAKGKGRARKGKHRSRETIIKMKRGRARKKQPKPSPPELKPISETSIEFDELTFEIGDVVKVLLGSESKESHIAQIVGFHRDQYCEKYVTVRWLTIAFPILNKEYYDPTYFQEGAICKEPINMRLLSYVMRLPIYSREIPPHGEREIKLGDKLFNADEPTPTLSSVDHQWYQLIY